MTSHKIVTREQWAAAREELLAFNLTQAQRALLAGRGVTVHAVVAGPVDTDMSRDLDIPKASPQSVARAILDAVDNGEQDIFPRPHVPCPGQRLAQRPGQGTRAPERRAPGRARHGISNGTTSITGYRDERTPPMAASHGRPHDKRLPHGLTPAT